MSKEVEKRIRFDGRQKTPEEKLAMAMKLAHEALEDESRERRELEARFEALRAYCNDLKAGVEVIVHMALIEDVDDRDPDDVVKAVIARLTGPN